MSTRDNETDVREGENVEQPTSRTEASAAERPGPSRRDFLAGSLTSSVGGAALGRLGIAGAAAAAIGSRSEAEVVFPEEPNERRVSARRIRVQAADFQSLKTGAPQFPNTDDGAYPDTRAVYGKALPHTALGEPNSFAYAVLKQALETGNEADFDAIPLGHLRPLANPQAALSYGLEGADQSAHSMPAAPTFDSAETAGEMVEVYWQALTRDVPFAQYSTDPLIAAACADLTALSDFKGPTIGGQVIPETLFRHSLTTGLVGPYLSQFLWQPVPYGVHTIEQRYLFPVANLDFATSTNKWFDVQRGVPQLDNPLLTVPRYMSNGRDLGEYVHNDFSYQAYLNAALILLDIGSTTLDPTNPYLSYGTQEPFATLGGPDVLTLIAKASQLALKAAWFQKWAVHRRLRPEAFAGRVHNHVEGNKVYDMHPDVLNSDALFRVGRKHGTHYLPLAFPEGSPTHPAYPAGHAVMAGACTTILKAFFDENFILPNTVVATADGSQLEPFNGRQLTVGSELSKLAANITLGRDTAGVHWRTDGFEGMVLGEEVAIGLLQDILRTYNETHPGFSFTRFDGTPVLVTKPFP